MSKEELKALHSQGYIREVIDVLLEESADGRFHNEVVQQSDRWRVYEQSIRNASEAPDSLRILRNKIGSAVLSLIDEVYNEKRSCKTSNNWWKYVVQIGIVVGILAGIISSLKHLNIISSGSFSKTGSISVRVHGPGGVKDLQSLPKKGELTLFRGDEITPKPINGIGEVTFKQVDEIYATGKSPVRFSFTDLLGENYELQRKDSVYHVTPGETIFLVVELKGTDTLEGLVKDTDTGRRIDSVHIRIYGSSFYTNEHGEFKLTIPKDQQAKFIDLRFEKEGYETKELQRVPTATERKQVVGLKPI